ncbi:MAG: HD domain-containing protein [Planctomycetes bacterium]|nr:HD domain-containing protein [Planctomycetota bacterium]
MAFVLQENPVNPAVDPLIGRVGEFLDSLACGALLLSRTGQVLHANRRLCELLGPEAREFRLNQLGNVGAAPQESDADLLQTLVRAGEREAELLRKTGPPLLVTVSARSVGPGATAAYFVVTVVDLSRQQAMQRELEERFNDIAQLSDTVLNQALDLKSYSAQLEEKVRQRTQELNQANHDAIYMLAIAGEAKDADTGEHVKRVQRLTILVAKHLGIGEATAEQYGYSAVLHDVGKMRVPDAILKKPAALTSSERQDIETHTLVGEQILAETPFFAVARQIVRSHHENWDGSGYPDGLRGEAIPLPARIVRLVDVYDGLVSARAYKSAWPHEKAIQYIHENAGKLFDPAVVAAFDKLVSAGELLTKASP